MTPRTVSIDCAFHGPPVEALKRHLQGMKLGTVMCIQNFTLADGTALPVDAVEALFQRVTDNRVYMTWTEANEWGMNLFVLYADDVTQRELEDS